MPALCSCAEAAIREQRDRVAGEVCEPGDADQIPASPAPGPRQDDAEDRQAEDRDVSDRVDEVADDPGGRFPRGVRDVVETEGHERSRRDKYDNEAVEQVCGAQLDDVTAHQQRQPDVGRGEEPCPQEVRKRGGRGRCTAKRLVGHRKVA
jgi:hypothetical protein